MFATILWSNYIIALFTGLLLCKLLLGFRWYSQVFKQRVGHSKIKMPFIDQLGKKESNAKVNDPMNSEGNSSVSSSAYFSTLDEVEELSVRFIGMVTKIVESNLDRATFTNNLKLILAEYPKVKISSFRWIVNELIVAELDKYAELSLSYQQVDEFWEEVD